MAQRPLVTLINTNRMEPLVAPIGLDYVAEALVGEGCEVDILDLALAESDARDALSAHLSAREPDVIGITLRNTDDCYMASGESFLPDLRAVVEAARAVSDSQIVLGGAGFSVMPEAVLEATGVDIGVWCEGELSLPLVARRVAQGESLDDVPNLVLRDGEGWRRTKPVLADLSKVPARSRSFVDNRAYVDRGGQGSIETKRGCSKSCIYCADPVAKGRRQRLRPPTAVADEIESLCAQGVNCLHLCDSEFNLPEAHARAVCDELIGRGLSGQVTWYTYASPVPFSPQLAELMRAAGCVGIDFGADSGSDEQLARLSRDFSRANLVETARACRAAGITFMYDILLGGPGETRETVVETIELMKRIEPDRVGVSVGVRLYPGTPLAQRVERQGFRPADTTLHGAVDGNRSMREPVFYVSNWLGEEIWGVASDVVGDDPRFFFTDATQPAQNYNYNDNRLLVEAIARGERGAYWDILRRLALPEPGPARRPSAPPVDDA